MRPSQPLDKTVTALDEQNMKDRMKAYKKLGYNTKLICDHKEKIDL